MSQKESRNSGHVLGRLSLCEGLSNARPHILCHFSLCEGLFNLLLPEVCEMPSHVLCHLSICEGQGTPGHVPCHLLLHEGLLNAKFTRHHCSLLPAL